MTIIAAAILTDGRRCMITDGQCNSGDRIVSYRMPKTLQGPGYLLGTAGDPFVKPFLKDALAECKGDWSTDNVTQRIHAACKDANIGDVWDAVGFIGERLVFIDCTGDVSFADYTYFCIGSGAPYATGFLDASAQEADGEMYHVTQETLERAVLCAMNYSASCGGLIQVSYDE